MSLEQINGMGEGSMNQRPWRLLYRLEDGQKVWLYEPLWGKELKRRQREGWELCRS